MKAIILAAGYATRLYPLTKNTPKALLKINNKTILDFIFDRLNDLGLDDIYIVTNNKFYKHFLKWTKGKNISVVNDGTKSENERLGAIGDINFVLKNEKLDDDLLVINGDNFFEFDVRDFLNFCPKKPKIASFDLHDLEKAKHYGVLMVEENKIIRFEEKPLNPFSTLVSTGVYFFPKNEARLIQDYILGGGQRDRTGDFIQWLVQHTKVYAYPIMGKWFDIGTKEILEEARKEFC